MYLASHSKYSDFGDFMSIKEPPEFLKDRLKRLLTASDTTDCSFLLKDPRTDADVIIKAHQFQLAMASPVFQSLFYEKFQDYNIPLVGIEPDIFDLFLQIAYMQEPNIESPVQAVRLYDFCKLYNARDGVKFVQNWIKANSSPKNAIILYECAKEHNDKLLEEKCLQQFNQNTLEVLQSEHFTSAHPSVVNRIFKMETLSINSEKDLIQALDRYLEANKDNHINVRMDLRDALYSIRFLTLEIDDILETNLLSDMEKVLILKDFQKIAPVNCETLPYFNLERLPRFNLNEFESNLRAVIYCKLINGKSRLMVNPKYWNKIEPDDRKRVLEIIKKYQHEMLQLYSQAHCLELREIFRKHELLGVHKRKDVDDESRVLLKTPDSSPDHKVSKLF